MRRIGLVALALALLIGGSLLWYNATPDAEEILEDARQAFQNQRYADAERQAVALISSDNWVVEAAILAAKSAAAQQDLSRAIAHLESTHWDGSQEQVQAMLHLARWLQNGA